jgi:hypothetical protein
MCEPGYDAHMLFLAHHISDASGYRVPYSSICAKRMTPQGNLKRDEIIIQMRVTADSRTYSDREPLQRNRVETQHRRNEEAFVQKIMVKLGRSSLRGQMRRPLDCSHQHDDRSTGTILTAIYKSPFEDAVPSSEQGTILDLLQEVLEAFRFPVIGLKIV